MGGRTTRCAGILFAAWAALAGAAGAKPPPPRSPIAVVRAEVACRAAERGYAAQLAERTARWLGTGGVKADLVGDGRPEAAFAGRRLVYLVVCQKPSADILRALERLRARGGKIAVLQSYAPELAAFMGVAAPGPAAHRADAVAVQAASCGWWVSNLFTADEEEDEEGVLCRHQRGRIGTSARRVLKEKSEILPLFLR